MPGTADALVADVWWTYHEGFTMLGMMSLSLQDERNGKCYEYVKMIPV
jgi:hypothetical protein